MDNATTDPIAFGAGQDAEAKRLFLDGHYAEAVQIYRHLLSAREGKFGFHHPCLVNNLNNLAFSLNELGAHEEAFDHSERALDIIEQSLGSEHIEFAKGLGNLGVLLVAHGGSYYSGAEDALRRSHAILEKSLGQGHVEVTKSLLNLASLLYMRGSYGEAEPLFRINFTILKQLLGEEHLDIVEHLNNWAGCVHRLGNYAGAGSLYRQSLALREKLLDPYHPDVALALNNLATHLACLGDYAEAGRLYQRSLAISEKRLGANHPATAACLGNLAGLHSGCGDQDKAEPLLRRALKIQSELFGSEHLEVAKSLRTLADCLCRLGGYGESEAFYRQSLSILKKRFGLDHPEVATSQRSLANLLRKQGKHTDAEPLYHRSLATMTQRLGPEHSEVAICLICVARLYADTNRTPGAILLAKRAINIFQKTRQNISNISEAHLQLFDDSLESSYDFLADLLVRSGRYGEAEYVMGMLKDKELLEQLRQDKNSNVSVKSVAWNDPEASYVEALDKTSSDLISIGGQIAVLKSSGDRLGEHSSQLANLEERLYQGCQELFQHIVRLGNELIGPHSIKHDDGHLCRLIDLTGALPNSVAIFTVTTENSFHTVMVTPHERIPYTSSLSKYELSKSILSLRLLLKNPESARKEFMPLAKELYDIIVRPMEAALRDKGIETIIWMLDGALRALPLCSLHDGNQFMLEKFRNVYITTLSDNRAAKHEPWNGLGMGTTQEHGDLQPLPAVKDELEGIICSGGSAGVLPGKILLDESFTRDSMQAGIAEGYKAVHFASHFVLSPVNETLSYLLLGDGSKIRMDELRNLPKMFSGVDLVTFSACSTGLSSASNLGREIDGIGYLGEQHGSKAVIATLWPVDDKSTSMLMREFYRLREAGNSRSQSLQMAQCALLRDKLISEEGHDLTHPFFWAPFILIGNAS